MSGPLVRPAGTADIEAASGLLHRLMNPKIPQARWARLLDYPWRPPEAERGWLVEDAGRIVGFMATVYSDRPTSRGPRRFCDLGAWYLERAYRGGGIGQELLRAGMARPEVTYATMTARAATGRRIRALGFRILDDTRRLFRPGGEAHLRLAAPGDGAEARLPPDTARLLHDHRGLGLRAAIVPGRDPPVLVLLQEKRKDGHVLYRDLLHCSDPGFLADHAQALCNALETGETGVLAVDSRFLPEDFTGGTLETIPLARWFRSPDVAPREVDLLYGETLLLDMKLP